MLYIHVVEAAEFTNLFETSLKPVCIVHVVEAAEFINLFETSLKTVCVVCTCGGGCRVYKPV